CVVWFSLIEAAFLGEWPQSLLPNLSVISNLDDFQQADNTHRFKLVTIHEWLFSGGVNQVSRQRESLFSDTLVLPYFNIYEALKIEDRSKADSRDTLINLRGRDLNGAVFVHANLSKADLHSALLDDADLSNAQLSGVNLYGASLRRARLTFAQLPGAELSWAVARFALLDSAGLQGASLDEADFSCARLTDVHFEGATLTNAKLQGAIIDRAYLQSAILDGANLLAASLDDAYLQGASLSYVVDENGEPLNQGVESIKVRKANLQNVTMVRASIWMADIGR